MLNQTTQIAIRALLHVGIVDARGPVPLPQLAADLGVSSTYLVKVTGHLVRAGIVRSVRGIRGGILLGRPPAQISLLDVVEACQGRILGDYCDGGAELDEVCAFHRAMLELHEETKRVLGRWTLSDMIARPEGERDGRVVRTCKTKLVSLGLPPRRYRSKK